MSLSANENIRAGFVTDLDGRQVVVVDDITIQDVTVSNEVEIKNDSGNAVPVTHAITTVTDGRTVVTTAGTRVALASSTACKEVLVTAEADNTGIVVLGAAATVVAAIATRRGVPLSAGDSVVFQTDNLADLGLDSTVSTDGVTYVAFS